jgi:hypothetical protein
MLGILALVLLLVGFIGTVLTFFRVAIHAYKEQGPLWGLLCLFVPSANLAWGAVHWNDEDARAVFVQYLTCCGLLLAGMILSRLAQG